MYWFPHKFHMDSRRCIFFQIYLLFIQKKNMSLYNGKISAYAQSIINILICASITTISIQNSINDVSKKKNEKECNIIKSIKSYRFWAYYSIPIGKRLKIKICSRRRNSFYINKKLKNFSNQIWIIFDGSEFSLIFMYPDLMIHII